MISWLSWLKPSNVIRRRQENPKAFDHGSLAVVAVLCAAFSAASGQVWEMLLWAAVGTTQIGSMSDADTLKIQRDHIAALERRCADLPMECERLKERELEI